MQSTSWKQLVAVGATACAGYLLGQTVWSKCINGKSTTTTSTTTSTPASTSAEHKGDDEELQLPLRETKNNPALSITAMSRKKGLQHVAWKGKRVLMRVDYNVPLDNGKVTDTARIDGTIDTIKYVLSEGPKCVVLIAHLGRPKAGTANREKYSLRPCVPVLQEYFPDSPVVFADNCVGDDVVKMTKECKTGTIILCENLRYHPEETAKLTGDKEKDASIHAFRQGLSQLGDVFVFEAFGAAHRPHSSVVGIDIQERVAGLLMQKEMGMYARVLGQTQRPFLAILGGSKISDKIQVIDNLLESVDEMIIGGGMAYTFKKVAFNMKIGGSIFDYKGAALVTSILRKAQQRGVKLHFPTDHIVGDALSNDARTGISTDSAGIPKGFMGLDCGPESRRRFAEVMARAKTILWNGPLGVFEKGPFAGGTLRAMDDLVRATQNGCITVIGGGDTGAAAHKFRINNQLVSDQLTHVSTGGGSSLVLMEGKMLPAVSALSDMEPNDNPEVVSPLLDGKVRGISVAEDTKQQA